MNPDDLAQPLQKGWRTSASPTSLSPPVAREVVLGRNATVWRKLQAMPGVAEVFACAIGHRELSTFTFSPLDRVWIFSYSRDPSENQAMLNRVRDAGVAEVVYVSSSSTAVAERTSCWEYPRVKLAAEQMARELCRARILTLGLVHDQPEELPAGCNAATSLQQLADFMLAPHWLDGDVQRQPLWRVVERPMTGVVESCLHGVYGRLQALCGSNPCLLRPLDLLLRAVGMRWYGYTYMSNQIWTSTTS